MKKTIVSISACVLFWQCGLMAGTDVKASKEGASKMDVSIYQVPWRCPAALQIGCGRHAKPILLELEQNPGVSKAWVNRQGTAGGVGLEGEEQGEERGEAGEKMWQGEGERQRGGAEDESTAR